MFNQSVLPSWGQQTLQGTSWVSLGQWLIIIAIALWIYFKVRRTYVSQLLKGLTILFIVYVFTKILGLDVLSRILETLLQLSIIGFIIIFQPELRSILSYIGQRDLLIKRIFAAGRSADKVDNLINSICESVETMSIGKIGALLVLESSNGLDFSYFKTGTFIDAKVSSELILTIFFPKTALHDGATIISWEGRIVASGVVLPLSSSSLRWQNGTRHRAALGMTENTDAYCLVVSEETGGVSLAYKGHIEKIQDIKELRLRLEMIYGLGTQKRHYFAHPIKLNLDSLLRWFRVLSRKPGN